ncbi:unnamed protein product [Rhizoctonia solani]|uniref:Nephrocystin 3-like N-terminal domain-containing protein n=1 Tax=Rhizoctonia solani TaxID=456999 RepID=A0A8H3BWE8_9AGAM|nr:unnamed protein product [Rhizoctonia solani]
MFGRKGFSKLKLGIRTRVHPAEGPTKPEKKSIQNPLQKKPEDGIDSDDWPQLTSFLETLREKPDLPWLEDPLQKAIDVFIGHIQAFEAEPKERHEYKILQDQFEALFKELQQIINSGVSRPYMTDATKRLCGMIKYEFSNISGLEKQDYDQNVASAGVQNDHDERSLLNCYRRAYKHFQRVRGRLILENVPSIISTLGDDLGTLGSPDRLDWVEGAPDYCHPNTRVGVLSRIFTWVDDPSSGPVYWINGMAGTGKTTIAYTLSSKLDIANKLAARFFCSRSIPKQRQVSSIIPSIAFQLAEFSDPFYNSLLDVLEDSSLQLDQHSPGLLVDSLISRPLLDVKDTLPDHIVIIIDAIDECEDKRGTSQLLESARAPNTRYNGKSEQADDFTSVSP